ncbi:unnamed protein product [Ilex paraguariensis]|uniref:Disease resistance protein RGA3 n=1 Tax=Ilex paraguariensis TaxID=185542 RepID=A0ABC8UUA8_9AQUA
MAIQGVAADLVKEILNKIVSVAAEEIGLVWGFKGELAKLKDTVKMNQAFLADAERRGVNDESVELWLEMLKDEAYRADDVLDEFAYEIGRRKVEIRDQMRRKVRSFLSSSNPVLFRSRMAHKIKKINTYLVKINEEAKVLGLRLGLLAAPSQVTVDHQGTDSLLHQGVSQVATPQVFAGRETNSLLHQSEVVVARDGDASNIVQMLTSPENQDVVSVLPIVGMAGLGKTTLAKLVYNGDEITRHFGSRIWVCVSENFDVKRLLKEILETLTEEKCYAETEDVILKKLRKKLEGQKYLLVLDDVWNEDHNKWNDFKSCMLRVSTTHGNNILIITRSHKVASIVETLPKYCVEPLSSEDCWSIFKGVAFANGGAPINSDLEDIGRKIAEKCEGVPLAAKIAGSMMHLKKDKDEWLAILNDGVWSAVGDANGVLPIIKLSFDHLSSPSLKHCFAYCSLFRKDSHMEKEQLIQLWMAQEYLQPKEGSSKEMEDIGNEYFESLLQSSLFQDIVKDGYDNITHCKMHDLVHDLSQLISKPDCFTQEDDKGKENPRVRHLALYSRRESVGNIQNESAERLRTLFLKSFLLDRFLKLRYLRVLNLCDAYVNELPSSISKLVHLRYLDLSDSGIDSLPKSIVKLYHLQTLRLSGWVTIQKFPKKFKNLTSLRHIYFDKWDNMVQLPHEIRWLTSLQTLPFFIVGKDKGFQIEELGYLKNLRGKLDIYDLQEVGSKEEAQKADLCGKKNIYKLTLNWKSVRNGNQNAEGVLDGLQPSPSLKGLDINGFPGDNFPLWMMKMAVTTNGEDVWLSLNNLVTVRLKGCRRCELIPMLGRLPLLRDLEMDEMDNVKCLGESFYGYDCHGSGTSHISNETEVLFPSLSRFTMRKMANLEEWIELPEGSGVQAFPCLYELSIEGCPQLKSAPSHFPLLKELRYENVYNFQLKSAPTKLEIDGLDDLTSLRDQPFQDYKYLEVLEISNCPKLTQVPYLRGYDTTSCLRSLEIKDCEQLSNLPDGLNTHPSLEILNVNWCPNLNSIPSIQGLTSLCELSLRWCNGLTCLPSGLESCTSLNTLEVEHCTNLTSFPNIQALCSLSTLTIVYCEKLTCLPKGLQFLTCLVHLMIGPFSEELDSFPSLDGVQHLHASLSTVTLYGQPHWDLIPEQLQHLCALRDLCLISFGMEALPDWFGKLSSLEELHVRKCKKLKYLPKIEVMQRLTKLWTLRLGECPLLEERCERGGPECPKVFNLRVSYGGFWWY